MHAFPHRYSVTATGGPQGEVPVSAAGLRTLPTASPPEFDGPDGYWSPETLLTAAVANCFLLTFRSVTRRAAFEWNSLDVDVEGVLEKTPEGLRFTQFRVKAILDAKGADAAKPDELLHKAEKGCLVAASLKATVTLETALTT